MQPRVRCCERDSPAGDVRRLIESSHRDKDPRVAAPTVDSISESRRAGRSIGRNIDVIRDDEGAHTLLSSPPAAR